MRKGRQLTVKTPGKNKKVAVFGAWCYGRGLFVYHHQPQKNAWGMRYLVQHLLRRAKQTGKRIILVLDQGNPNNAHALHRDLDSARPWIETFWLPHYCWELNLIERIWKHIKGSRIADVLFSSFRQFRWHLQDALIDFARHPDLTFSITRTPRAKNIRINLCALT